MEEHFDIQMYAKAKLDFNQRDRVWLLCEGEYVPFRRERTCTFNRLGADGGIGWLCEGDGAMSDFYASAKFANERLASDRILLKQRGEYVPYVKERTCTMDRDEYGYWVCSGCGETLPAWIDKYPAYYCPYCGAKVVEE